MRNIESCLDWFPFPVKECCLSGHFYLENRTEIMLHFETQAELCSRSLLHRGNCENLSGRRGSRADNDSSLFTAARADGWKNKEVSVGLFKVLTLTGTKRNEENLDLKTAKQRTVSQQLGIFFFPMKWLKKT